VTDEGGEMQRGSLTLSGPTHGTHDAPEMTMGLDPEGTKQWSIGPMLAYEAPDSTGLTVLGSEIVTGNLSVFGNLDANNIRAGRVSIQSTTANVPAMVTVTGLDMSGLPRAVATPSTTVPGTQCLGVGCTSVTQTSMVIWCTRTNTGSTGVDYIVIGT
jgi:hypothetical protein